MDELLELLEAKKHLPTIVEGKRDRASLEQLGFSSIIEIDRALFVVVERFTKGDTVQILTDLDKKGKELYGRLRKDLVARGVKIDDGIRNTLFTTELSHIEGLFRYVLRNS